jgi:hypothetical protein
MGQVIASKISKTAQYTTVFLMVLLFLGSCGEENVGEYAPVISLNEVEIVKKSDGSDSLLVIRFDYEDKDGDLGLDDGDTTGVFRGMNNLIINFEEKINGKYEALMDPTRTQEANYHQRFPNLTPTGKNKNITGTMAVMFSVSPNEIYADTLAFDLHIVDRKLNQSNFIRVTDVTLVQ